MSHIFGRFSISFALLLIVSAAGTGKAQEKLAPAEKILFDFEDPAELAAWSNIVLPEGKPGDRPRDLPAKIELSTENASSGKQSLKITFAGGEWPAVATERIPEDWLTHQSFKAAVTVSRPCLVGFNIFQEKSQRGGGWDEMVSRWTKTVLCQTGKNEVMAALRQPNEYSISPRFGKVVRLEIFMYEPLPGEAIYVDNLRLSADKEAKEPAVQFRIFGSDEKTVADIQELARQLKPKWTKPVPRSIDQVEADFAAAYEKIKAKNPRAVMVIFRDGEKGYDPAQPEKVYDGWSDGHVNGHGPDSNTEARAKNTGKSPSEEHFMRHRSVLMRADLSSIPKGSEILAAQLVVNRVGGYIDEGRNPEKDPNVWVAEPCNRPWVESEVNAYQYARGKFWKAVSGKYYGKDPDFFPLFFVLGPGGGQVSSWDFTEAVKFWTDGRQENHGFMLHGDSHDYLKAHYRESPEARKRPAIFVIYVPRER